MSVRRFDRGELAKPERLPNGWLRVDGFIARAGLLEYCREDGTPWVEYRPPDEAFKADVLASFAMVPFTNGHPAEGLLDAHNTKQYQRGTVEVPTQDGDRVRTRIMVTDADTVRDIEAGKVELSCGYTCQLDFTPGEINGKRYDAIQRDVRGNHVALVPQGRAGPEFRLRVDSADAVVIPSNESAQPKGKGNKKMIKIKIDGVEVEVSELAAQLIGREREANKTRADELTAQANKLTARADAAEADAAKLKADVAALPAKIRGEVQARAELENSARKFLGTEAKFDDKTDTQIKAEVAAKVLGVKLDGKPDAYVDASYEIAITRKDATENVDAAEALAAARAGTKEINHADAQSVEAAQKAYEQRVANAHRTPAK